MSIYVLIPIVETTFCVGLLVLLIVNGLRHIARKPFSLFLIFMGLWGFFIFMMRSASSLEDAFFWEKWVFFAILSAALFFYRFTLSFTSTKESKRILYPVYLFYVASMALVPTGLVVSGMQMMWYGKAPVIGPLFFLYVLTAYAPIVLGLRVLIRHYRQSKSLNERVRDSYIIAGIIATLIGATTDFLPSLGISMYPLGIIGSILFCVLATIAMLRYGLLEIKVVLRRGAAYSLISILMLVIFAVVIFLTSSFFQEVRRPIVWIIAIVIVFAVAVVFHPVQIRVQRVVDRWFFRDRYDHLKALERFTKDTKDIMELKELSLSLLSMIAQGMQSRSVYLLLPSPQSGDFVNYAQYGQTSAGSLCFPANSLLTQAMKFQDSLVDVNDIDIIPSLRDISDSDREILATNQLELLIPLKTKERLTGILVLGSKVSGETYSTEDRQLLSTVSNQAAISIENARLYEELKQLLMKSSKLASLGELAANVAHEVNNSLQSVINFGTILSQDMSDADLKKDCKIIETEALRARNIVEMLLGMVRKERTEKEAADINDLLRSVVNLARLRTKSGNITIIENYSRQTPLVFGSAEQLRQVFLNILTNAIDAIPNEGKIVVQTAIKSKHVVVTIADTGIGIPSHLIGRLFEPLFTTKENGTGLGLTVSLSIVRDHGGTIDVDSVENQGTKFTVTLPRLE